jgi:broad specificity phosphatase PhoE
MKKSLVTLAAVIALLVPIAATAQTVFLVRHAERADTAPGQPVMAAAGADPELSAAGRARAESLASMLKDANITAIFTTKFKRTIQTGEPLAKLLGIPVTPIEPIGMPGLVQLIERIKAAKGNVLVVGHSNTVPDVIKGLGVAEKIEIADTEFDNLFVVTPGIQPRFVRLHYR